EGADFVVENVHGGRLFDTGQPVKKKTEPASGDPTARAWGKWLQFEPQRARLETDSTAQSRSVRQNAGSRRCCHPMRPSPAVWRRLLQGPMPRHRRSGALPGGTRCAASDFRPPFVTSMRFVILLSIRCE